MGKGNIFIRLVRLTRKEGGAYLLCAVAVNLKWRLEYLSRLLRPRRTFSFQGASYPLFWHLYNVTRRNERTTEIPLFREWISRHPEKRILEVGNVLSHYLPVAHDIVDKYEKETGIINEDIVRFHPDKDYDLVVCISTLEHIGWDEEEKSPEKISFAMTRMQALLAPEETLVLSFPLGHNPYLNQMVESGDLPLTDCLFLKRVSRTAWAESNWEDVRESRCDDPFEGANGLVFGTWVKSAN